MSFSRIKILALFLATSCTVVGTSAVSPALANNLFMETLNNTFTKPGTATKPGTGSVGSMSPRSKAGTTSRGRIGRSK